jgi:superfamily II DNA helicase RecQ
MSSTTTSSDDSKPAAPTKIGFPLAALGTATTPTSTASLTVRSHVPYAVLQQEAQWNLQTIFGFPSLRNLQPSAVKCALEFKSQTIILNTGAGKSLCYQLPATVMGGVTFVISPLIALMLDQVHALNQKGIAAALISSSQTETQNRAILERLLGRPLTNTKQQNSTSSSNNKNKDNDNKASSTQKQLVLNGDKNNDNNSSSPPLTLLYITPESIKTDSFRSILSELYKQRRIAMFAVDEAHCLSR